MPDFVDQWGAPTWLTSEQCPADEYVPAKTGMEWLGSDIDETSPKPGQHSDSKNEQEDFASSVPHGGADTMTDLADLTGSPSVPAPEEDFPEHNNQEEQLLEEDFETSWPKLPSKAKKKPEVFALRVREPTHEVLLESIQEPSKIMPVSSCLCTCTWTQGMGRRCGLRHVP